MDNLMHRREPRTGAARASGPWNFPDARAKALAKQIVVRLALAGALSPPLAGWLLRVGGLRDA